MRFSEAKDFCITFAEADSLLAAATSELRHRTGDDAIAQKVDLVQLVAEVANQFRTFVMARNEQKA